MYLFQKQLGTKQVPKGSFGASSVQVPRKKRQTWVEINSVKTSYIQVDQLVGLVLVVFSKYATSRKKTQSFFIQTQMNSSSHPVLTISLLNGATYN